MLCHPIEAQIVGMGMIDSAGILVFFTEHASAVQIVQIFVTFCPGSGTGFHDNSVSQDEVSLLRLILAQSRETGTAHDQNGRVRLMLSQPGVEGIMLGSEFFNIKISQFQILKKIF